MMAERERRVMTMELRASDDGTRIEGYAAVFNTETTIGPWFRESIAAGAFREAIGRDDVRALFNHDPNVVLGRTTSGTLTLTEDDRGLRYTIDPPDTQAARDLLVSVKRGDITQSSFAFSVDEDADEEWVRTKGELPLRIIKRASLYDVSPVTYPAYEATTVSARSKDAALDDPQAAAGDPYEIVLAFDRLRFVDAVTR